MSAFIPVHRHGFEWLRRGLSLLALAVTLSACPETPPTVEPPPPPPPPPPSLELHSKALGTVNLQWLSGNRDSLTDSSGRVRFTPLIYSDIDHLPSLSRYLTVTYKVENLSAEPFENLGIRAVAGAGNLGGTAVFDLHCASGALNCTTDTLITNESVAQRILPIQGTTLNPDLSADPTASDFQAYRASESATLEAEARAATLLPDTARPLDYGFTVRDSVGSGRTVAAGGQGILNLAVRLPRRFTDISVATPYSFKLSFLVTADSQLRVSRGSGETTDAALSRATSLGSAANPAQLALVGADTDAPAAPNVKVLRLENLRVGLTTKLIP